MIIETLEGEQIDLQTGNEILCSGTGHLSKLIIKYNKLMGIKGQAVELSHVAKFICGNVFEATTLNKWCNKKGYQMNPFADWLEHYSGKVWVRQTQGLFINESIYEKIAIGMLATPYESGIPGLLELLFTGIAAKTPGLKRLAKKYLETKNLHCSEANVILSQKGGYYDEAARPNKLPPSTFWRGGKYERGFTRGILLPPKQIK